MQEASLPAGNHPGALGNQPPPGMAQNTMVEIVDQGADQRKPQQEDNNNQSEDEESEEKVQEGPVDHFFEKIQDDYAFIDEEDRMEALLKTEKRRAL